MSLKGVCLRGGLDNDSICELPCSTTFEGEDPLDDMAASESVEGHMGG